MALLEKHLVIKRSTIPGAGKGLFTKIFIPKETLIVEYKGKVTTWKNANHDDGKNAYIYYVNSLHVIDALNHQKSPARFANDNKGPYKADSIKNNSQYVQSGKRVFIQSMKDIAAGSEILVGYGKGYWDVLKQNKAI